MKAFELTELEAKVLALCAERKFFPDDATEEEQDAQIALIEKATDYEAENELIDERIAFTEDCNLLVWFAHKRDEYLAAQKV